MRAGWLGCVVLIGCAQPSIELRLEMPESSANFDMSCLTAVDVMGFSNSMLEEAQPDIGLHADEFNEQPACAVVANVTSFADLESQLQGQIDVPLPAGGLTAIELRGRAGSCNQLPYGQALVYGGGQYLSGASFVSVAVEPNISCQTATKMKVQPIDMLGLIADPAHACKLQADTSNGDVTYPAVIRPSELATMADIPDQMMFEAGTDYEPLGDDGTATVSTYSAAVAGSCIAVARESEAFIGSTCVNHGAPTLCASDASTVELPIVSGAKSDPVYDDALITQYGLPVIGFVWSKTDTTKAPLANATVSVADPTKVQIIYMDVVNGNLATTMLGATNDKGIFLIYTSGVTTITVSAPGHTAEHLQIGPANGLQGTVLAVLE